MSKAPVARRLLCCFTLLCSPLATAAADKDADAFVERINQELKEESPEINSAAWLASTYINSDSQLVSAKAGERALQLLGERVEAAQKFLNAPMSEQSKRALLLLRLSLTVPPLKNTKELQELSNLLTQLEGEYGAGQWCPDKNNPTKCLSIGDIEEIIANPNNTYEQKLDAWEGWHTISIPMRSQYQRATQLMNIGAKEQGFADTGVIWRSGYDMSPTEFSATIEGLYETVSPLYQKLHCYVRNKLVEKYGDKGQVNGLLPAHLMGNLWQQEWSELWPILQPYSKLKPLDVTPQLQKQQDAYLKRLLLEHRQNIGGRPTAVQRAEIEHQAQLAQAKDMVRMAEKFYVSLGMPQLPASFWEKSQFIKPRDRDVVCHASAWDVDDQDVRVKMCIKPTEDDLRTIFHELGHVYYYLAYAEQPALFQSGANDGFHEAIGDAIVLAMTPQFLFEQGLLTQAPTVSDEAVINSQMREALDRIAFLPFGYLIDKWRWGVFDGSIAPEHYNQAWWDLKAKYQGVAPVTPRGETFFDPGAKYHVPGNTPYIRYFLAHIYMFQFYKALCDAAGHKGPLHECSYYNSKEAGTRFWAMLQKGQSQPWQQTLKELTGTDKTDASAIVDYFAPLSAWLDKQNQNSKCGW